MVWKLFGAGFWGDWVGAGGFPPSSSAPAHLCGNYLFARKPSWTLVLNSASFFTFLDSKHKGTLEAQLTTNSPGRVGTRQRLEHSRVGGAVGEGRSPHPFRTQTPPPARRERKE